jgi:hypothetical protein
MTLLLTKEQAMHFCRNIPQLVAKMWEELKALDTRITNLDTENNTEYPEVYLPADSAANTWEREILPVPVDGTIEDVLVVPDIGIGQATNYMALAVVNKGDEGSGTDDLGSLSVTSTNPITAHVGVDLVSENAAVAAGDKIVLKKTVTGDGQAWPGGIVQVKFTRN